MKTFYPKSPLKNTWPVFLCPTIAIIGSHQAQAQNHKQFALQHVQGISIETPKYLHVKHDVAEESPVIILMRDAHDHVYLEVKLLAEGTDLNSLYRLETKMEEDLIHQNGILLSSRNLNINHFRAIQTRTTQTIKGKQLACVTTFIETPQGIYEIFAWASSHHADLLADIEFSVGSFSFDATESDEKTHGVN